MFAHRHFSQVTFLLLLTCFATIEAKCDDTYYTNAERTAIDKLRPLIAVYLVPDYMKTDVYHLRLLKAAKFDVKNAVKIVKRNTKWRKQNNVDGILNEDLNEYFPDFPFKMEGVDKEGRPVVQFYIGGWRFRKYALLADRELRNVPVKVTIHMLETVEQRLYEIQKSGGLNISSTYFVQDIAGYSLKEHACPQCLSQSAELIRALSHYPSIMKRAILINAPRIFAKISQLINEILPSDDAQSISIYPPNENEWKHEVLRDISADQLPMDFGGTKDNWYNKE